MKKILSVLILCFIYTLSAIEINVGDKKIFLPSLDGMVYASSVSQKVVNYMSGMMTANIKTLEGYIELSDAKRFESGQDAVYDKYAIVVTPVNALSKNVTSKEFLHLKKYFRSKFDVLLEKQKDVIKEFNQTKIKVDKVVPLGINYETDIFLSASMLSTVKTSSDDNTAEAVTKVATLNCVLVKGKIIVVYVYKNYKSENDLEWVKETGKKLSEEIIALNKNNAAAPIKQISAEELLSAAKQGNAEYQILIAALLLYEKKDYENAAIWLQKAANQGHAVAQETLGDFYENGKGVKKDPIQAMLWYQKAAEQGNAEAQYKLGMCYIKVEDAHNAFKWFQKAALQNNTKALTMLGMHYSKGLGVEKDYIKAVECFQKAAEQGDVQAQFLLGASYLVVKDYKKAKTWYQKAAEQGHALAQYDLALCYDKGLGVTIDEAEADKWMRKAAEQGVAKAQARVAVCYALGINVAKDDKQAVKWCQLAAKQGDADAQYMLGLFYLDGRGVGKDKEKGIDWLHKAAQSGHADAKNLLINIK